MNEITIRKESSSEVNISDRTVSYDIYKNNKYIKTFYDIIDALDYKNTLENK